MDVIIDNEEDQYISLYCSNYIREATDAAAARRETQETNNSGEPQQAH